MLLAADVAVAVAAVVAVAVAPIVAVAVARAVGRAVAVAVARVVAVAVAWAVAVGVAPESTISWNACAVLPLQSQIWSWGPSATDAPGTSRQRPDARPTIL